MKNRAMKNHVTNDELPTTAPQAGSAWSDPRPQCRAASPCTSWPGPGPCWCRGPILSAVARGTAPEQPHR